MAKGYGPLEVPSWAIGVVFTFFLIVTLVWDRMLRAAEQWLHKRNKPALTKVMHALKDEILAVGMIVLLLPLFENHLMEICIPKDWADKAPGYNPTGWDLTPADPVQAYTPPTTTAEPSAPLPTSPATAGDAVPTTPPTGRRKLLVDAASTTTSSSNSQPQKQKEEQSAICEAGWTQLFPLEAIHGIHIFIALTALVHIFYACVCMLLCMLRMRRWHSWEVEAMMTPLFSINSRVIKSVGKTKLSHSVLALINTFFLPMTKRMYLALRRLFMEGLKQQGQLPHVPQDFPYSAYVQESMQYSFCDVVSVSALVWLFAIIQLIIPYDKRVWCSVAISSVTIILMVAAGAKLHSIVVNLTARSYFLYHEEQAEEGHPSEENNLASATTSGSHQGSLELQPKLAQLAEVDSDVRIAVQERHNAISEQNNADRTIQAVQNALHRCKDVVRSPAPAAGSHIPVDQSESQDHLDGDLSPGKIVDAQAVASSPIAQRYEKYAARSKETDISSMFWFHRPKLLLLFFKVAYFQSAFCLTLVLFALWRSNQFLPNKAVTGELIAFFVLLVVNVGLSFFMSTCVLPVYAIVSVTDADAFTAAAVFAEQAERHKEMELIKQQQQQQQQQSSTSSNNQQYQQGMLALQKLHSHVGRMQDLATTAQGATAVQATDGTRSDHPFGDQKSQVMSSSAGSNQSNVHPAPPGWLDSQSWSSWGGSMQISRKGAELWGTVRSHVAAGRL